MTGATEMLTHRQLSYPARLLASMTTARYLAAIDALLREPFPAEHLPTRFGDSGPGFHRARPGPAGPEAHGPPADTDGRDGDPDGQAERCRAEGEALAAALRARWGPPEHLGLWSASVRDAAGRTPPAPWDEAVRRADDILLWRVGRRWAGLAAARCGEGRLELLVLVTEIDPP